MFTVKTPEEALSIIRTEFPALTGSESVPPDQALHRILAEDIIAEEYVPGFHRSTVDGYAVMAADTFGCSEALPSLLPLTGEIQMGDSSPCVLKPGSCVYVPTGGALPEGADSVVMKEYTEDYGDGTIGILKSSSPGLNVIYRGDDVYPGKAVLQKGRKLTAPDIGALAAMGFTSVPVRRRLAVGIISTGDELVPIEAVPAAGQIRDVNTALLAAFCLEAGALPHCYGILPDNPGLLSATMEQALRECDLVLVSGGSSVGTRDATALVMEKYCEILFHGLAMKPGKPTILGKAGNKPVFGLPGHPAAAFLVSRIFVRAAMASLNGCELKTQTFPAVLSEAVSANHGRSEVCGVRLRFENGHRTAVPIHSKSGLISSLAGSDGTFTISRDCEGLPAGSIVEVTLYSLD